MFPRDEAQDTAQLLQEDFDEFMEGQLDFNNWVLAAGAVVHPNKLTKQQYAIVLKLWEEFGSHGP